MKNQIKNILFIFSLSLLMVACTEKQNNNTIIGIVQEIQTGKDGYTAQIKTADNDIYYATISHANLADHSEYRTVQVSETIEITGDQWDMEGKKQVTVRKLYPKK